MTAPALSSVVPRLPVVLGMLFAAVSVYVGRLAATGQTRTLSLVLIALLAAVAAHLKPRTLLVITIVASPFPLFMQGMGAPLTPLLVAGTIIAAAAAGAAHARVPRSYVVVLFALAVAMLVSLWRGASSDSAEDITAAVRIVVGMALFLLCVVLLRPRDVPAAFRGIALSGLLVFAVTAMQLLEPSLSLPGMRGGFGTVNVGESGLAADLRVGGPIGDYELLAEFFAVTGTTALFLATTESRRRVLWLTAYATAWLGVTLTATRSGLVLLVLGTAAIALRAGARGRRFVVLGAVGAAGIVGAAVPMLQVAFQTGYGFERLAGTSFEGGFGQTLNRARVWDEFLAALPSTGDLVLGSGPSFDWAWYGIYPHNLALTLAISLGLAGAAAFAALLAVIALRAFRAWRASRTPSAYLVLVLLAVFVVNELKVEFVRLYNYEWFVWALLGVCAAAARDAHD